MTDGELIRRLRERLTLPGTIAGEVARGDFDLNPHLGGARPHRATLKPAAVLIPIVQRQPDMQVLFTRRADHLSRHAGQVSFPGGRVNEDDASVIDAALRETEEEVGLLRSHVEILGALDAYETGTGFSIQPIVGLVREGFDLKIDPDEVAEAFEVPLKFLMDERNHQTRSGVWQGVERRYYEIPYGRHYIWGATAGILVNLHHSLYR